jgi:hypothetical protein
MTYGVRVVFRCACRAAAILSGAAALTLTAGCGSKAPSPSKVSTRAGGLSAAQPVPQAEPAPTPDVSGMTFVPVSLAGAKKSYWAYYSDSVAVSPVGAGVRCDIKVGSKRPGYGGVTLPVSPLKALRLEMTFDDPSALLWIIVDGHSAKGRSLRWQWDLTKGGKPAAGVSASYTLVPGKASGYFSCPISSDRSQLTTLQVFVLAKRNAKTRFTLSKAEIAR